MNTDSLSPLFAPGTDGAPSGRDSDNASTTGQIGEPRTPKQQFLDTFEHEHATTMRVLNAYPPEKMDLRPHPKSRTARELAWVFVLECGLGEMVFKNEFETRGRQGSAPEPPESWSDIMTGLEGAHAQYGDLIRSTPDDELYETVRFFRAPKTIGDWTRIEWIWFILHDEIHHRGQLSVYLRMAEGKVPSIYGPSGDEPWF